MPRFNLNQKDTYTTLLFWLKNYLKFKILTLTNKNADENIIKTALFKLEKVESLEELHTIIKKIKEQVPIYTYFYPVYKFVVWLKDGVIEEIKDIDTFIVLEFLSSSTTGKSSATQLNYKNAIINFLKFIEDNNREDFHFNLKVSQWQKNLYRTKDKRPDYLTEEEIERFLDAVEKYIYTRGGRKSNKKEPKNDEYLKAMYKLAFKLALFGGLRIQEIANLKKDDLYINQDLDVVEIFIQESKNQKSRIVTIPYSKGRYAIKKDLDDFSQKRKDFLCNLTKCTPDTKLLFITYNCRKLTSSTMDTILKKILMEAGIITTKKGMHLLRHTHASLFYKKTQDVLLLKERLGHDNIRTTMRYTHLDEEKIKKSADAMR